MKKVISFLVAMILVFAMNVVVADTQLDKDNLSGQTLVTLTIDRTQDSYTVVIPSSVTIDPSTQQGTGTITLKSGWKLVASNSLKVKCKGNANGWGPEADFSTWKMVSEAGDSAYYSIVLENGYALKGAKTTITVSAYTL